MKITTTNSKIKIIFSLLLVLSIFTAFVSSNNNKKFLVTEGFASNSEAEKKVDAVNYALAKAFTNQEVFNGSVRAPTLVDRLPAKKPIETGEAQIAEEVKTENLFYDGTTGLKITVTRCASYETTPQACVNNKNCGWCASQNTCVSGSLTGPSNGECLKGRYTFNAPSDNWNPFEGQTGSNPAVVKKDLNLLGAHLTSYNIQ